MPPFTPGATAATSKKTLTKKPKLIIGRKKNCFFCLNREFEPDYKDTARLRRYLNERGRIVSQSKTRTCALHQRAISASIKQARDMALMG